MSRRRTRVAGPQSDRTRERVDTRWRILAAHPAVEAYQFFREAVRDEPLFTVPGMRIENVIPGRGDGYKAYEATLS
jgi:hypothetical protein